MRLLHRYSFWDRTTLGRVGGQAQGPARSVRVQLQLLEESALLTTFTPIPISYTDGFDRRMASWHGSTATASLRPPTAMPVPIAPREREMIWK